MGSGSKEAKYQFYQNQNNFWSDCSKISKQLSYIICYNRKSYNRTIEQKENTLNDVFFQNSIDTYLILRTYLKFTRLQSMIYRRKYPPFHRLTLTLVLRSHKTLPSILNIMSPMHLQI